MNKISRIVIEMISDFSEIEIDKIKLKSTFEELSIYNLDIAEIIMALEDKLKFSANRKMYQSKTVEELIEKINLIKK